MSDARSDHSADNRRDEQSAAEPAKPVAPSARQSLGAMWLYSALRFGVFFVLFGILWLARVPVFLAAVIAVFLSIPLSFVLLARPRARLAQNIEQRVEARKARGHDLDEKLAGDDPSDDGHP
ncbi:DUF4229 domain-containing protein [Jatrophihabitans sp. DSM 45814]